MTEAHEFRTGDRVSIQATVLDKTLGSDLVTLKIDGYEEGRPRVFANRLTMLTPAPEPELKEPPVRTVLEGENYRWFHMADGWHAQNVNYPKSIDINSYTFKDQQEVHGEKFKSAVKVYWGDRA